MQHLKWPTWMLVLVVGLGSSIVARQTGVPTPVPGPVTDAEVVPELKDAPGVDSVYWFCSECHEPASRILKLRRSTEGWSSVLTDMENRGMMAEPEELKVVLDYLSTHYNCAVPRKTGACPEPVDTAPATP